jgi:hypothetical protein
VLPTECATIGEPPIAPRFPKFASFHQPTLTLSQRARGRSAKRKIRNPNVEIRNKFKIGKYGNAKRGRGSKEKIRNPNAEILNKYEIGNRKYKTKGKKDGRSPNPRQSDENNLPDILRFDGEAAFGEHLGTR